MKSALSSFLIGILFALGLGISGMTSPAKVIGFLDIFGVWDPSLMFVMVGALVVHFISYRLILKRNSPLWSDRFHLPTKTSLDRSLIGGSVLFGLGWGLAGFCPAPALTALAGSSSESALVFVLAMIAGMILFRILVKWNPNLKN